MSITPIGSFGACGGDSPPSIPAYTPQGRTLIGQSSNAPPPSGSPHYQCICHGGGGVVSDRDIIDAVNFFDLTTISWNNESQLISLLGTTSLNQSTGPGPSWQGLPITGFMDTYGNSSSTGPIAAAASVAPTSTGSLAFVQRGDILYMGNYWVIYYARPLPTDPDYHGVITKICAGTAGTFSSPCNPQCGTWSPAIVSFPIPDVTVLADNIISYIGCPFSGDCAYSSSSGIRVPELFSAGCYYPIFTSTVLAQYAAICAAWSGHCLVDFGRIPACYPSPQDPFFGSEPP